MATAVRRKFTDCPVTHSMAHHLSATAHLISSRGYARVADIARFLDLTRGSVSVSMKGLRESGYIVQDENHFFQLTEKGVRTVRRLRIRYEVMKHFFRESLGLEEESAHLQSCQIAYLITPATTRRLAAFLESARQKPALAAGAGRCPLGDIPCDQPGSAANPDACAIDCLEQWLPAPSTPPPCKVTIDAD